MATVSKWTPFGVALDLTATGGAVTRISATQYTVSINVSWETYYSGAQTNYGMTAASGGVTKTISAFDGTKRSSGSGSFVGTYSISGNGSATKTITVTFRNFNTDNDDSATKNVTFNVTVPAWTSYTVKYNANGGSGAPGNQTKWKDQALTLSSTKPTRTGYSFQGWSTSTDTSVEYAAGAKYNANSAVTLYAVWKANTYAVKYNANGGSGAPSNQTKTYNVTLKLSSTKPTRSGYNFLGWATSASAKTATYVAGGNYTANSAATLYAVWESAYAKPRITDVSVVRCTSDGTANDEGTNAKVSFKWACDNTVTSIKIEWKPVTASTWSSSSITASGTSGTVSQIIGSNALSYESTYDIKITVADSGGTSYVTNYLFSMKLVIDLLAGGKGIAFGKTAENANVADFAFAIRSSHGEMISNPQPLPNGTDLDNWFTPGYFHAYDSTASATILHKPLWHVDSTSTFELQVSRMGGTGQLMQRYYACEKTAPLIFERMYYQSAWSEWNIIGGCTTWRNLTLASGFEVYGSGTTPKYRVNGNLVTITGAVKPAAAVTSNTTGVQFASGIPSYFCPKGVAQQFVCQGSGINRWLMSVNTDGSVSVSRYGTNSYVEISAGAWLTFCVTYSI